MWKADLLRIIKRLLVATFVALVVMIVPVLVLSILKYSVDEIFNDADLSKFLDHVYIFFLSIDVIMVLVVFYILVLPESKKDKTKS